MSSGLTLMLAVSLVGLVAGAGYLGIKHHRTAILVPTAVLVAAALAIWRFVLPEGVESKAAGDEVVPIALCYLSMLAGMVAQYGYAQAERGRRRRRFQVLAFLMPFFASPIVFIPLLTITSDMSMGGAVTQSKLMVYLVAFQNGFFWKGFFEQQRLRAVERTA